MDTNPIYTWGIIKTSITCVKFEDCIGYNIENVIKEIKLFVFILSDGIFQSYWRRKGKKATRNLQFILY